MYKEGDILTIVKSGTYTPNSYPPLGKICRITKARAFGSMGQMYGDEHTVEWWDPIKKKWADHWAPLSHGNLVRDCNVKKETGVERLLRYAKERRCQT